MRRLEIASLTYGSGLPPLSSTPHRGLLRHLALRSLVVAILAACGSSMERRSLASMVPVLRCFWDTCLGGPTLPLTKIVGRFLRSIWNRSATVLPDEGRM